MSGTLRCATCRKEILPGSRNPEFPFCSSRCRAVDLGRWLGEEYRIASRPDEEPDGDEEADSRSGGEGLDA